MARVWKKYMGGPTRSTRDEIHVTINNKFVFTLNRKAFEELGKPKAVVFYIEEATNVIGMASAQPQLTEAFPVHERTMPRGWKVWEIRGVTFCRENGIHIERTEKFVDPEFDPEGILQLDLRKTQATGKGKYDRGKPKS